MIVKYLAGYACRKLLAFYPKIPKYYMGLESRGPNYIYDVAYTDKDVERIGKEVTKGMKLKSTLEVSFGGLSHTTAKSLIDMANIQLNHFGKLDDGKFYRIEYTPAEGERVETFNEWCNRVMQRQPKDIKEKLQWYLEYGGISK